MAITLQSIESKLGFDPLNPPPVEFKDDWVVDDHTPSIWAPLTEEEHLFLTEIEFGKEIAESLREQHRRS